MVKNENDLKVQEVYSQDGKTQGGILLELLKNEELHFLGMLEEICSYRVRARFVDDDGLIKENKKNMEFRRNPDSFIKTELGKLIVTEAKIKSDIKCKTMKKIKEDPNHKVDKSFAVMIGLALKLKNVEMNDFLAKAGLTLYKRIPWDKIIIEHIDKGEFDPIIINIELDKHGYELFNVN
jgi:hypothetical protein